MGCATSSDIGGVALATEGMTDEAVGDGLLGAVGATDGRIIAGGGVLGVSGVHPATSIAPNNTLQQNLFE